MSIVPRMYEAPGLFSTTNGTFICCEICCTRMRISTSGEPPGAEGMTKRIGFSGYAACAQVARATSAMKARRFIEELAARAARLLEHLLPAKRELVGLA